MSGGSRDSTPPGRSGTSSSRSTDQKRIRQFLPRFTCDVVRALRYVVAAASLLRSLTQQSRDHCPASAGFFFSVEPTALAGFRLLLGRGNISSSRGEQGR